MMAKNNVSISVENSNILLKGYENPLTVVVEGVPANSYFLTTDNGQITKNLETNSFSILVKNGSECSIFINREINKKNVIIGAKKFRVKEPEMVAHISSQKDDSISKRIMEVSNFIIIQVKNVDCFPKIPILSKSLLVLRDSIPIYYEKSNGNEFSSKFKSYLNELKQNDRLFIYDILIPGIYSESKQKYVSPLLLTVKD
jgi:hypothetical protein